MYNEHPVQMYGGDERIFGRPFGGPWGFGRPFGFGFGRPWGFGFGRPWGWGIGLSPFLGGVAGGLLGSALFGPFAYGYGYPFYGSPYFW